jgi:hypothetical protein
MAAAAHAGPWAARARQENAASAHKANEMTLAGLHPGRDTLAARKMYGAMQRAPQAEKESNVVTWEDPCANETLRVEADDSGVIQFVTVDNEVHAGKCPDGRTGRKGGRWRTSHGLGIGDARSRVIQIYGQPGSEGPSTGEHREGELMYYAFDWAGSDVPQVMEIYCDRGTNRVIEIVLSNPSL